LISVCTSGGKAAIETYLEDALSGETPAFPTVYGKAAAALYKQIRSRGFPSNFIVDNTGMVRFRHWNLGAGNMKQFQREFDALIEE